MVQVRDLGGNLPFTSLPDPGSFCFFFAIFWVKFSFFVSTKPYMFSSTIHATLKEIKKGGCYPFRNAICAESTLQPWSQDLAKTAS